MNKFNVLQRGFSDCGPACLASVAAYYGLFVSLAEIQKNTVVNNHYMYTKRIVNNPSLY